MAEVRTAIAGGRYADFCAETKAKWSRGESARTP